MKDEFHLSPDGQVIAYGDNRTGTWEVFVASFPSFHDIKQVSLAGGVQPRWREDGKELFFIDPQGKMMSASDTGLVPDPTVNQYAVTEDGRRRSRVRVRLTGSGK